MLLNCFCQILVALHVSLAAGVPSGEKVENKSMNIFLKKCEKLHLAQHQEGKLFGRRQPGYQVEKTASKRCLECRNATSFGGTGSILSSPPVRKKQHQNRSMKRSGPGFGSYKSSRGHRAEPAHAKRVGCRLHEDKKCKGRAGKSARPAPNIGHDHHGGTMTVSVYGHLSGK